MTTLFSYLISLSNGLFTTVLLTLSASLVGLCLAILFTIISYSRLKLLKLITHSLTTFVRGTPLLVQLFLIYYGLGQFEWLRNSSAWIILREPMACAIIALAINTAAYTTILLQGAIRSVPYGEIAACEALGMTKWQAFWRIILPRAWRIALPAYSNEVIIILKCTSLASTITLMDLMGVTQALIAETYDTVTLYLLVGGIYWLLNIIIMTIFWLLTKSQRVYTTL